MKSFALSLSFLFTASAALIGCSKQAQETAAEAVKPVSYYVEHPDERDALLQKCLNDSSLLVTPNCQNAKSAAIK